MDAGPEALVADLDLSGVDPQDPEHLVGPFHLVRLGVPVPAADARDALRVRQRGLAVLDPVEVAALPDEIANAVHQERPVDRLGHEVGRADIVRAVDRLPVEARRRDQDRSRVRSVAVAQDAAHLEAVHSRHLDIEHQQIRALLLEARERGRAVGGLRHQEALRLERLAREGADQAIVVDHQDLRPGFVGIHATPLIDRGALEAERAPAELPVRGEATSGPAGKGASPAPSTRVAWTGPWTSPTDSGAS
jgi:hypothetical protein